MDLPNPFDAATAFAAFVRQRLAAVGDSVSPFAAHWGRAEQQHDGTTTASAVAMVIASAAAPFAATSYARARLLRQLHASGLLTATESERALSLLELAQ